ncbi:Fanconi anemia group J protein [Fasciola hepatica]|uniref:Fanconi anemia group J protein n=1 Tax=Fasciola hepatica TaxID=6192 RepID=A0A4E0RUG0_FASHE|nr:Fanconi anemia group J protein [Fasciola hepatica]
MDFLIQDIPINFPYKPYGCQLSIMNRVIEALESKRNCLLESPTGTGKTLSLLCASLAWVNKKLVDRETVSAKGLDDHCANNAVDVHQALKNEKMLDSDASLSLYDDVQEEKENQPEIPKIYFCTRTHKQISQVVRELRKTKYRNAKMTILSSRQHTCINPAIRKSPNITEACQNLLQSGVCEFDQARKKSSLTRALNKLDAGGPWDIEDLVAALTPVPTCPYFCSRKLAKTADIIFCPYNYLLDPINRSATLIELNGHIVILDEAHNIEDASRESASFKITDHQLIKTNEDLENLIKQNLEKDSCEQLKCMIAAVLRVMQLTRSRLVHAGESTQPTQVWTGTEISGLLGTVGLGPEQFLCVERAYRKLSSAVTENPSEVPSSNENSENKLKLASSSLHLMQALFVVLGYMFRDNQKYLKDFRVVLMETVNYERKSTGCSAELNESPLSSWISKRTNKTKTKLIENRELSLNFWCLNPAIVFREVASLAHCLILMSGTLSPLDALEAELGVDFPIRLEANHVIAKDRLFVASLAHGPGGNRLCATYQYQSTYAFQDEVGNLVLQACDIVPGGVLCFLPSYGLLDKLVQRWEATGLLENLRHVKHVMIEPRSSVGLDAWLEEFYAAIDQSENCGTPTRPRRRRCLKPGDTADNGNQIVAYPDLLDTQNGAIVLAVCRGKVSEGLDFADSYGRLVIAIGIPYPAFNSPQVQQKREFNDASRRLSASQLVAPHGQPQSPSTSSASISNCVLSGSDWYNAQAYRALNQALGRCIRHTEDWGAVLLADARFVEQPGRYLTGISRWIRSRVAHHNNWGDFAVRLRSFIETRTKVAKVENEANELGDIFSD